LHRLTASANRLISTSALNDAKPEDYHSPEAPK
jgi:hypothetical protein